MPYLEMRDASRIYYEDEGNGRPVVFLHGWQGSSECFCDVSERLRQEFRCIRYDQRGHMRSSVPKTPPTLRSLAEDLQEILVQLQVESPLLVGWSMGGSTLLEYIRLYGCEKLRGIVIVDSTPCFLNTERWPLGVCKGTYDAARLQEDERLLETDFLQFLHRFFLDSDPRYRLLSDQEQQQMLRAEMEGHDPVVLASLWRSMCREDYREDLKRITVPSIIFYGDPGSLYGSDTAVYMQRQISGEATLVPFSPGSHMLIYEHPVRFADQIRIAASK